MTNKIIELKSLKQTIPSFLQYSFSNYSRNPFLGFVAQSPLTYQEVQSKISNLIFNLSSLGISKGDKVGILSHNMPNWAIVYYSVTSMGAIAVPILPDFTTEEINNILKHSETKVLFVSDKLVEKVKTIKTKYLHTFIDINNLSIISTSTNVSNISEGLFSSTSYDVEEEDTALIIYTSGTTAKSKGVMLSHKNLMFNVVRCLVFQEIFPRDVFLSILPLSHAYENTVGLNLPMICGASVYYTDKLPTPSLLVEAMEIVKPSIMLSVPLVIEKIYRNKVLPNINSKPLTKFMYKISIFRKLLNYFAGKKLIKSFGSNIRFFGIGGAKLDTTVEKFLIEAKFPYAVGYGLTETSPLIAGLRPEHVKLGSTGKVFEDIEIKLDNIDTKTGEGEILVRGNMVMQGYYKEPQLTAEVIDTEGWFRTGDIATIDKKGHIYIKGRCKNIIVGSSGENIYPEEIESIINKFNSVIESLVVKKGGKLVAMVHLNKEDIELKYNNLKISLDEKLELYKSELKIYINSKVNKFSNVSYITIQNYPFEKTPTQKIKRYKYNL